MSLITDRSKEPIVVASYIPKGEHPSYLDNCMGIKYKFKFKYLSTVNGIKVYDPIDKNFLSSSPIKETDLVFE